MLAIRNNVSLSPLFYSNENKLGLSHAAGEHFVVDDADLESTRFGKADKVVRFATSYQLRTFVDLGSFGFTRIQK
jgi:hypothetical protein